MLGNSQEETYQIYKKAGLTYEKLLATTNRLIKVIQSGEFKPRNKDKELSKLLMMRAAFIKGMAEEKERNNYGQ